MERAALIRYGTILLILFFAVGYLWPLLYAPSGQELGATPTPPVVTSTSGNTTVFVASLSNRLVLLCSGTQLDAVKPLIENVTGVDRVIFGGSILDVTMANESALLPVLGVFNASCPTQASALRGASFDFPKGLQINSSAGIQFVPSSALKSVPGFVFASTEANSTVKACFTLSESRFDVQETLDESSCPRS